MKFRMITWLTISILAGLLLAAYPLIFTFGSKDKKEYWQLMADANPAHATAPSTPYIAKQQHRQAHKDIWFNDKGQRLHMYLRSADSELVLDHHDNTTEVVEHMYRVKCYMQEEIYYVLPDGREVEYRSNGQLRLRHGTQENLVFDSKKLKPMQIIRYMEAEKAAYYYHGDRFVADQVQISQFSVAGHSLIESISGLKPLMSGIAKSAEFSLVGNDLHFKAHQLKAKLNGSKR